jgi:hypothetical protein
VDITRTVEPKSDQLNFDDVATAPLTITITAVEAGPTDQPVHLHNAEYPGRPYKPGKSMRRVLLAAWGKEASDYVGRKITLYGDPTIKFGKEAIGGIRIRAVSHITEPVTVALTINRGKRSPFTVQPIPTAPKKDESGRDWIAELSKIEGDAAAINRLGHEAKDAGAKENVLVVIRKAHAAARPPASEERTERGEQQ